MGSNRYKGARELEIYQISPLQQKDLELFYKTSDKYLEKLNRHDDKYLKNYVNFVSKYIKDRKKLLDLGCGNGRSTYLISRVRKELLTIGCDISFKFLSNTLSLKKNNQNNNIVYLVANVANLPFKSEEIDIISLFQLIEHISEVENSLTEMIRVLKKEGIIIIMSPNLLSPFLPLKAILMGCNSKYKNMYRDESIYHNLYSLLRNTFIILNKIVSKEVKFLFRKPDLNENLLGYDLDSIYLANQIDIKKFFIKNGFRIINVAKGMSFMGRILAKLFPNFSGEIGIVAKKMV